MGTADIVRVESPLAPTPDWVLKWSTWLRASYSSVTKPRICPRLELDLRVVAHGRVCGSARRRLSSACHILWRASLGTVVRTWMGAIPRKCTSVVPKATI